MKLKRKVELTFYSLFSIVTFNKYYICDECHKIHKRTGNEFAVCGGWYEPYVFVSNDCANATINRAYKVLRDSIWDEYWIVFKNGEYVSGTDEFGYPLHTKDRSKAFKFYDFNTAMSFFNLGYAVIKN